VKISAIVVTCALAISSVAFSADFIFVSASEVKAQQYLSYNFGRVRIGDMRRVRYNVQNTGNVVLSRTGFSIGGPGYDAYTNCPRFMNPGEVCDLEIRFWPSLEGANFGRLHMDFREAEGITIDLFGEAYRY
jgi:hypothetical protein